MNRTELVEAVADEADLGRKQVEVAVNAIFETLMDAIVRGERVEIRGFGSFSSRRYDGYTGRNPRTGEPIDVPEKLLPFFKVGKDLRERVDNGVDFGE